ncbi:hypothetical protein [Geomesophilobacter sediminis]|uniref:Uncharacterized protein n=1 Tax=Geomesophilobacter sediminis TaxID=2798584 RepID=A0A8J7INP8_9BACT|nr:hypothetical protein [Geomesophilobacter sediminis]MBJ6724923.1 hypothetical protein [Geomesophilobacter sediminis]
MYLARDKNNDLYLFADLPTRGRDCWWAEAGIDGTYLRLKNSLYPEVSWESEPRKVSIVMDTESGE